VANEIPKFRYMTGGQVTGTHTMTPPRLSTASRFHPCMGDSAARR